MTVSPALSWVALPPAEAITVPVVNALELVPVTVVSDSADCSAWFAMFRAEVSRLWMAVSPLLAASIVLCAVAAYFFGGCILALGRALGETMAVTMVIGNDPSIRWSFLRQANTISSIIANEYGEAADLKLASLMELALILFVMTLGVNLIARYLTGKLGIKPAVK